MPIYSPLNPPLPSEADNRLQWGQLNTEAAALAIGQFALKKPTPLLVIVPSIAIANKLEQALHFFFPTPPFPILRFPDWETLPYDHFSPHTDIVSERLMTLYRLPRFNKGIIITAVSTAMHRLCPSHYIETHAFAVSVGEKFSLENNKARLIQSGYQSVSQVMEHAEFAQRGSILDIFPTGAKLPYRIELFDDDIISIRSFDPTTQQSIKKIDSVHIFPAREYPLTNSAIDYFRQRFRSLFSGNPKKSPLYEKISSGLPTAGTEYYLPLFFEETHTLFDYMPHSLVVFLFDNVFSTAQTFWKEVNESYEHRRYDKTRPLCAPDTVFFKRPSIRNKNKK